VAAGVRVVVPGHASPYQTRDLPMMRLRALPRLVLALAAAGLAPSAAWGQDLTPREIAAAAQRATVQIRALDARGEVGGLGSGFFISPDGTLVTNFHVIQDAHALQVETFDGEVYDNVYYVTSEPRRDVAVLKIPVEGAVSLRLGSDTAAVVGAEVFAMGNPLGQTATFSDGLVSATRTVEGVSMIQISAPHLLRLVRRPGDGRARGGDRGGHHGVDGRAEPELRRARALRSPPAGDGRPAPALSRSLLPRASAGLAAVGERPDTGSGSSRAGGRARQRSTGTGDEWEEQVITLLQAGEGMIEGQGFVRTHEYQTGTLRRGGSEGVHVRLDAGVTYMLLGVCDTDCDDVDLRIFGPRGGLLDSDVALDDFPVVSVTPAVSGDYTVRVTMAECDTSLCYYAVGVYGSQ
jgi:hypothetical protein